MAPEYMKDVQGFDLLGSGALASLPFIINLIVVFIACIGLDYLLHKVRDSWTDHRSTVSYFCVVEMTLDLEKRRLWQDKITKNLEFVCIRSSNNITLLHFIMWLQFSGSYHSNLYRVWDERFWISCPNGKDSIHEKFYLLEFFLSRILDKPTFCDMAPRLAGVLHGIGDACYSAGGFVVPLMINAMITDDPYLIRPVVPSDEFSNWCFQDWMMLLRRQCYWPRAPLT